VHYFAYGSNLNLPHLRDWLRRCKVDPAGVTNPRHAVLPSYRFRTNYLTASSMGAANIEPSRGKVVEGLLLTISPEVQEALRAKEGHPRRYEETEVEVIDPKSGRFINAITYQVTLDHRLLFDVPVSNRYLRFVLEGAKAIPLSPDYQASLRSMLWAPKAIDSLAMIQRALLERGTEMPYRERRWLNRRDWRRFLA